VTKYFWPSEFKFGKDTLLSGIMYSTKCSLFVGHLMMLCNLQWLLSIEQHDTMIKYGVD
jgi:hypothetical protein